MIDFRTLQRWVKLYNQGGIMKLLTIHQKPLKVGQLITKPIYTAIEERVKSSENCFFEKSLNIIGSSNKRLCASIFNK